MLGRTEAISHDRFRAVVDPGAVTARPQRSRGAMIKALRTTSDAALAAASAAQPRCDICGHLLTSHDPVGLRYCEISQQKVLTRSCICS